MQLPLMDQCLAESNPGRQEALVQLDSFFKETPGLISIATFQMAAADFVLQASHDLCLGPHVPIGQAGLQQPFLYAMRFDPFPASDMDVPNAIKRRWIRRVDPEDFL